MRCQSEGCRASSAKLGTGKVKGQKFQGKFCVTFARQFCDACLLAQLTLTRTLAQRNRQRSWPEAVPLACSQRRGPRQMARSGEHSQDKQCGAFSPTNPEACSLNVLLSLEIKELARYKTQGKNCVAEEFGVVMFPARRWGKLDIVLSLKTPQNDRQLWKQ